MAAGPLGKGGSGSPLFPQEDDTRSSRAAPAKRGLRVTELYRPRSRANPSQYVAREVLVFDQVRQCRADVLDLDANGAPRVLGAREGNFLEESLQDRVEAPGTDVLQGSIDPFRVTRDLANGLFRKLKIDVLRSQQRRVLLEQSILGLGQNPNEVLLSQGIELDPYRKAALKLRNEVGRLGHVKGAGGDEQDMVGLDESVLRID